MAKRGVSATVPRLRFPAFRGTDEWRTTPLERIAERVAIKNCDGRVTRALTNSAEFGVLDQRDYFDKDIATAGKVDGYYIVNKGDYVYNPRTSAIAPVGPISRNNVGEGVMSPLYTVFRFSADQTDFYEHYFRSTGWHSYLRSSASTGARHDRLSITAGAFMRMPVPTPSPEEQQNIADCLASLDDVITGQARKVKALKVHKRGLMQQLFPCEGETRPRLRFPEFRNAPEWSGRHLGGLSESVSSGRDRADAQGAFELYGSTGVIGKTSNATFHGKFILVARVGANAGLLTMASGDFGVTDNAILIAFKNPEITNFVFYYLDAINLNKMVFGSGQPLITGGQLKELVIYLPNKDEQQRIVDCLSSLDAQITGESSQLATLKTHKHGLMQQLFPTPEGS